MVTCENGPDAEVPRSTLNPLSFAELSLQVRWIFAADTAVAQASAAQQSVSGVNLDEEAANLIRYQQAYQAAGKVMQTATQLFDVLLSIGA